jgi:hypothetical protein
MDEIEALLQALSQFHDERYLAQFHNAKNIELTISIEVTELDEQFL